MNRFYFLVTCTFLITVLISCSENHVDSGGEQKEYITESAPESDSVVVLYDAFNEQINQKLANYFSPQLLADLNLYVHHFREMKTETEFEANYREGMELFTRMDEELYNPVTDYLINLSKDYEYWEPAEVILDDLQKMNGQIGPIDFSCTAECTTLDYTYSMESLNEKSKLTSGKADDDFIKLLTYIEGPYGYAGYPGFKIWFEQTWDLGGMSLLGDGSMLEALQQLINLQKSTKLFADEIELIKQDALNDLAYGFIYKFSPEAVLKEYDDILELNLFSGKDLESIQKQYNAIKTGGEGFQFNCENGDCAFG